MARRNDKVGSDGTGAGGDRAREPAGAVTPAATAPTVSAFDLWLDRGLHQLFDTVAREPVPEALLKIIEESRGKK